MISRKVALYVTAAVVFATVAHVLHGSSHTLHGVPLSVWQWAYVISVIFVAPVVAASLTWTRYRRGGAWLLLASMLGSLIFGVAYHYLVSGPDNVFSLHHGAWQTPFVLTATLSTISEATGCLVGVWAIDRLSRSRVAPTAARRGAGPAGTHQDSGT